MVVDTLGLRLVFFVSAGSVQDRVAAPILLGILAQRFSRLKRLWAGLWADRGYSGELVQWAKQALSWAVERSFAWLTRSRRLTRDCEGSPETTEAWFSLANIRLMSRRLEPAP